MTVAPVRPDIEPPAPHDIYPYDAKDPEEQPAEVVRWENPITVALAYLLYALGWIIGLVSIPCNWCLGALRAGWDSARRLGGI